MTPPVLDPALASGLVKRLAQGLHFAGVPVPRLEEAVTRLGERLGIGVQVLATPTSLILDVEGEGVDMWRVPPGDIDLGRLARLDGWLRELERQAWPIAEALPRLEELLAPTPHPPAVFDVIAGAIASAGAAALFGGSIQDLLASLGLGALIGAAPIALRRWPHLVRLGTPLSAALVSFVAFSLARSGAFPNLDPGRVTLASLIALVPGYGVTIALTELALQHLVSGTARLAGVLVTLLGMGLGAGLGQALAGYLPGTAIEMASAGTGELGIAFALLTAPLCFAALFRARKIDAVWISIGGWIGYAGARLGTHLFGLELGAFLGALALGAFANLLARLTPRPESTVLVPGLMLLVPGTLGFRSIDAFLANDAMVGVEEAFRMLIVAAALGAGILGGQILLPSRRIL